ncbi:hypothetical protein CDAR_280861 [Caerostris darwini]|uniref:Uncharacterized protein n=1 Tax=Caerostris darwini TaxID=1538125 RepID=A0AAV4VUH1_9ARAC|nr:hypothetical protein CDAR_280861 [Caerostris darwini]
MGEGLLHYIHILEQSTVSLKVRFALVLLLESSKMVFRLLDRFQDRHEIVLFGLVVSFEHGSPKEYMTEGEKFFLSKLEHREVIEVTNENDEWNHRNAELRNSEAFRNLNTQYSNVIPKPFPKLDPNCA